MGLVFKYTIVLTDAPTVDSEHQILTIIKQYIMLAQWNVAWYGGVYIHQLYNQPPRPGPVPTLCTAPLHEIQCYSIEVADQDVPQVVIRMVTVHVEVETAMCLQHGCNATCVLLFVVCRR